MTSTLVCGFFFLGATVVSGTLFEIDTRPLAMAAGGIFLLAAALMPGASARALWAERGTPGWSARAFVLGMIACAPASLGLAFSLGQEFPFAGDAAFHISVHVRTALFWLTPLGSDAAIRPSLEGVPSLAIADLVRARGLILAASIAAIVVASRAGFARAALVLAGGGAAAWAFAEHFPFQRYPGLVYFAGVPINLAIGALAPTEAATSPRLVAYLALPVWLFVLRPWIVGRAPDARGVAAAFLLFWGERQIYWQSAPYLETWAMCGVLLALETLYDRGRQGAALACLCIGAAGCAKEQAILFLPFVWLAGLPWRQAGENAPWRSDQMLAGFAAGLPFVFHALLRESAGGARNLGREGFDAGAWLEGAIIWASRVPGYFAEAGYLPLAATIVGFGFALLRPAGRAAAFAAAGGMTAGFLLYALDSFGAGGFSDALAGYYRFVAPFLPALAVGAFALADRAGSEKVALGLAAALAIVQMPGAIAGVRLMAAESERRNGHEDGNGAIFVPLRMLLESAERDGAIDRRTVVTVASPTPFSAPHPAAARGRELRFLDASGFECGCSAERPAVIAVYVLRDPAAAVRFAGVPRVHEIPLAPGTRAAKNEPPAAYAACRAALETTCGYVRTREIDGVPTGVIGAGPR